MHLRDNKLLSYFIYYKKYISRKLILYKITHIVNRYVKKSAILWLFLLFLYYNLILAQMF